MVEAVVESVRGQEADLQASSTRSSPRTRSWPPTPPRCRSPRSPPPTPSPGRVIGVHFFNPAPVQGFVEIVQTVVTEPEVLEDVASLVAGARQEPRRLRRQGRLHRQHAALRLPQPRGLDVREPLRLPRGHRRRDALRLRLPDGSAGPARPDRPRHGVRDPRHDVPPGPRPPARAGADPQADGHRGHARPQDRQGLLHLRGRRQPGRRGRRQDAVGRRQAPAQARHQPVGVVGTGTMATGIVEVFAKSGYDVHLRRPLRRTRSTACGRRSSARWTRRSSAASSRSRPRTRCSAG